MQAWFLREWQRNSPWQLLLRPVSWLFRLIVAFRRALFRSGLLAAHRLPVATIVVGNITVGGTGKTPLVLAIVDHLTRVGRRCGIVTRGYVPRGAPDHSAFVIHVVPHQVAVPIASDEAMLLANRSGVPVYAGRDRAEAGRTLLRDHPAVDTIVCDDGLQHYALARDIEIAVIDVARGFGNGGMLPAGPLREPASRLASVDAIVLHTSAPGTAETGNAPRTEGVPHVTMRLGNEAFVQLQGHRIQTVAQMLAACAGRRIVAVAGTGNPQRFFDHLARLGFTLQATTAFPDHHPYRAADIAVSDADIVLMTEKDAVKCLQFADARHWFMRVDALVPDSLGALLLERLFNLGR
jgi:tetraacyldisaccharide 4'-kinase